MQIPHTALSDTALQNLLEEFVTREGTDYGLQHYSLADKVLQVRRQLETGRALIVYDPATSTCHIQTREWLLQHPKESKESKESEEPSGQPEQE